MTLHANITPIRANVYAKAREVAFSAGDDWPKIMGAANTLAQSPDWADQNVARHLRDAYELRRAGLLKPVDPRHRDKADLVDQWRAQVLVDDTPVKVALRHADKWPQIVAGGLCGALVILAVAGWFV